MHLPRRCSINAGRCASVAARRAASSFCPSLLLCAASEREVQNIVGLPLPHRPRVYAATAIAQAFEPPRPATNVAELIDEGMHVTAEHDVCICIMCRLSGDPYWPKDPRRCV